MGLYDTLDLPAGLSLPGLERDPSTINWQTKSISRPAMRRFRITPAGRLLQEEVHTEAVPEEERPYYGTDDWEEPIRQLAGSIRQVHEGWSVRQYHGLVRFVASVDDDLLEYEAKFTDGRLVAVRDVGGDERAWIPVEPVGEAGATDPTEWRTGTDPNRTDAGPPTDTAEASLAYQRTGTIPLVEMIEGYGVSIPEGSLTDTRREGRYLQLLHLPDDRGRQRSESDEPIASRRVHEIVVREPLSIEERDDGTPHPISAIIEREGPYEADAALRRAVALAESRALPIHHEVVRLRPDHWSDSSMWVTCPDCGSDEIGLETALDGTEIALTCHACEARVTTTERTVMFRDWLHCPSCTSGDVNVELSPAHGGGNWWSCDDCGYDTRPAPIDTAYTNAKDGEPPGSPGD